MAMVTRCPACDTTFRVTPPQLQAQHGVVRCGRCMTVFDGFKSLATVDENPVADAAAEPAPAVIEPAVVEPPAERQAPSEPAAPEPAPATLEPAPAFALEPVSALELAAAAEPAPEAVARREGAEDVRDYGPPPEQLTIDDHLELEESREAQTRRARLWAAAAVLLIAVLAFQVAYFYRGEVAAHFPQLRPHLARVCEWARCSIDLPQRPRLIAIEASDLQATDTARPGVIQLTATVRNHAGYAIGYPALDLVLTNTREHTLARRIFLPRDYLESGRDPRAGIPAHAEMTIRLDLDTGDLNPAGFRLDLLAAPPG